MIQKKNINLQSSSTIARYIYVLLSVIIVITILIFTIIKEQSDNHAKQTIKTHDFYLVGISISNRIQDSIDQARFVILQASINKPNDQGELENIIFKLRSSNMRIQELHKKYNDPDFATLIERIDRIINQEDVDHILKSHAITPNKNKPINVHFDSIYATAHQLERLYARKLGKIANLETRFSNTLGAQQILIILILFMIAIIFTFLTIKAIKRVGNEQIETNHQLDQFKTTLDNTNDCVFIFTADTLKFTYFNNGAIKQVGYTPDELITMSPYDIKPDFNEVQFKEMISPMLNGEMDFYFFETIHQHKDGHNIPVEIGLQYIHPENDTPHFLAIVRDITERKRAEEKLQKYHLQLEELVEERTEELRTAQDELVRKERLATLGNLTATVSHELRNPLGSMRPSLYVIETITRDNNNEKLQTAVQRLNRSIDRCDNIIDELLDYTRITELSLQTVVLDDWLGEVIHEQPLLDGIQLIYQPDLDNTRVDIDADRLRRAVINIFENACHAMLEDNSTTKVINGASLTIKTLLANDRINISIGDSGSGIPDEVMKRIFEPLFSTKGFGVGLGMPTVQQIMKQHRGGIDIDTGSAGTTITLWLPLAA